jgi:hypothetical protein
MIEDFGWLNPHLTATAEWNGERRVDIRASNPEWRKWRACDPTSAHWYDQARFERYMAAHISRDQDFGRDRTVRQFIAEFRGLTGTAKKKAVLDAINASRLTLPTFFGTGEEINRDGIARLLAECKTQTRTVKPIELGVIGKGHLLERFITKGVKEETFKYQRVFGMDDEVPYVVEAAFGWCPDGIDARRIITGVNWSVGIHNPFRSLRRYDGGLDSLLTEQRAGGREPIIFLLHYVCPRIEYTDRANQRSSFPELAIGDDDKIHRRSNCRRRQTGHQGLVPAAKSRGTRQRSPMPSLGPSCCDAARDLDKGGRLVGHGACICCG